MNNNIRKKKSGSVPIRSKYESSNEGKFFRRPHSFSNVDTQHAIPVIHSMEDECCVQRRLSAEFHSMDSCLETKPKSQLVVDLSSSSSDKSSSDQSSSPIVCKAINSAFQIVIDLSSSSDQSSSDQLASPNVCETNDSKSITSPDIVDSDSKTQTPIPKINELDDAGIGNVDQFQRRFSPRLHPNLQPHKEGEKQHTTPKSNPKESGGLQRRLSPRLHPVGQKGNQKKTVTNGVANDKKRSLSDNDVHAKSCTSSSKRSKQQGSKLDSKHSYCNGTISPAGSGSNSNMKLKSHNDPDPAHRVLRKSTRVRVMETLKIFNTYYRQFLKSKDNHSSNRPDMKAVSKMREKKEILYPEKIIGHVPGIEVGYQFSSRAEMVAIGFHCHWLDGIDYIGQSVGKKERIRPYTFPIAVAIVMSSQYEDELGRSQDFIYTGQGGHDLADNKLQHANQILVHGDLAMKNSMEQCVPVRVIRGHKSTDSYSGKIYRYDGLYKIVNTWADKGQRGHLVHKFQLLWFDGQPKLTTKQVLFARGCQSKVFFELPGLVCKDISNGLEDICIPVTNLFDDAPIFSKDFTYIKNLQVAKSVQLPSNAAGCDCKGSCTNPLTCACAKLNGSKFPYIYCGGGRLVEAKDIVFECGLNCTCGPKCLNRTSQKEIKYHLEVYRTVDKGWALRSWDFIPSGSPVCEYIGLLRRSDEVDSTLGNEYIFEIDCWHTINEVEGRERRFKSLPVSASNILATIDKKTLDSPPEFCIDAGRTGNVARFMNHSCEPNLFVQCILSSHRDLRLARIVFFASDDIPPMQELTYDYGFTLDSVVGPDGKVKVMPCFCGTPDCRKRLY